MSKYLGFSRGKVASKANEAFFKFSYNILNTGV